MQQTETIAFIIISSILLIVFVLATIAFVFQYRKKRIQHENEKGMITVKHNKELLETQLEMQMQTMQHIGREIHDNVGQKLTLASLYTQQLSYENKAPHINEKIENISHIINESLQELRRLSKSLTDDNIAKKNLVHLVAEECKKINEIEKIEVKFSSSNQIIDVEYQTKSILLRVVQEFLQNSIKHSKCTLIKICLTLDGDLLKVELSDNGIGFITDKMNYTGIGLKNIAKRINLLNGYHHLKSNVNKGTCLVVEIPIKK